MNIIAAKEEDLYRILEMLKNSAIWLRGKGINYWQNWLNPPKEHVEWIKEGLEKNQFYFVEWNNEIIGVFRLQYEDEMFWGKITEKAGYVHSFTINREQKFQGKGKEVLRYIEKYLARNGINLLRLDCGIEIDGLVKYYKNYGFKEKGEIEIHGEKLLLLEKECIA